MPEEQLQDLVLVRTLIGIANPKLRSSTALCDGLATASKVVRMAAEVIPW
jgi:hypothetical protein